MVFSFVNFLEILGISLQEFVRETQATVKLRTKFIDWQPEGHSYWHPFGNIGERINAQPFFQQGLKAALDQRVGAYTDYSPSAAIADAHKFYIPNPARLNNLSRMGFALHFDTTLGAAFVRNYATRYAVRHIASTVAALKQAPEGNVEALLLPDGRTIGGELSLD